LKTCPRCRNTGAVDDRYCTCEAAIALRARIDADPRMQELRTRIDRLLGDAESRTVLVADVGLRVIHPLGPKVKN